MSCVDGGASNEAKVRQFVESCLSSWQQPGLFGNFRGTPSDNESIICNPLLEASFGEEMFSWDSGGYLKISFRSPSYVYIF